MIEWYRRSSILTELAERAIGHRHLQSGVATRVLCLFSLTYDPSGNERVNPCLEQREGAEAGITSQDLRSVIAKEH
jgi:hypothetical protein